MTAARTHSALSFPVVWTKLGSLHKSINCLHFQELGFGSHAEFGIVYDAGILLPAPVHCTEMMKTSY